MSQTFDYTHAYICLHHVFPVIQLALNQYSNISRDYCGEPYSPPSKQILNALSTLILGVQGTLTSLTHPVDISGQENDGKLSLLALYGEEQKYRGEVGAEKR